MLIALLYDVVTHSDCLAECRSSPPDQEKASLLWIGHEVIRCHESQYVSCITLEFRDTVDFGYKERGYKEQPLIMEQMSAGRIFYFIKSAAYKEQSPVIRNTTMSSNNEFC